MKKILRGVALAQNKIEPSKININANIPVKLPCFYDDSDDEDEEPPKAPSTNKPIPEVVKVVKSEKIEK